ncbi:MAG: AMP-binding protein [Anaerovoracaceae bacterium]
MYSAAAAQRLEIRIPQRQYHDLRQMLEDDVRRFAARPAFRLRAQNSQKGRPPAAAPAEVEISYRRFGTWNAELGAALARMPGWQSGISVALLGENSCSWVLGYFAALSAGARVVPLDKGLPREECASLLRRSRARVLFFDRAHRKLADELRHRGETGVEQWILLDDEALIRAAENCDEHSRENEAAAASNADSTAGSKASAAALKADGTAGSKASAAASNADGTAGSNAGAAGTGDAEVLSLPALLREGAALRRRGFDPCRDLPLDADTCSVLLFTSGTTSRAKAVMLSQRNLCANLYGFTSCQRIVPGDVNLAFLPYHHTYGALAAMLAPLACGACSIYCSGLRQLQRTLREAHVTVFMAVPLILEKLYHKAVARVAAQPGSAADEAAQNAAQKDALRRELGADLRLVMTGGSVADPQVLDGLNEAGILTAQIYGLTETSPAITIENDVHRRSGSVGKALPNVSLRILSPDRDGVGEIAVQAPSVMLGYEGDPAATKAVLRQEADSLWFHTGDRGFLDDDGFLYLRGRSRNVIVLKSGKNVYPEELETLVNRLPYVRECLVSGVPRRGRSEDDPVVCLKLVYDPAWFRRRSIAPQPAAIRRLVDRDLDAINETLPAHQQIKKLILTDEPLHRTTSAKIRRGREQEKLRTESIEQAVNL